MRIAILSDACDPPANGVSRTLGMLRSCLETLGHEVNVIEPRQFPTLPVPTDPGIRVAVAPGRAVARRLDSFQPDAVLLATEGPVGWAGRAWCRRRGQPFVSLFTTRFAEAIHARLRIPTAWTYALLRRFHRPSAALLVATASLRAELKERGFINVTPWTRGVDTTLFRPRPKDFLDLPRPIFLYVGRLAPEKSVEDFLRLDLPGSKLVVGDGTERATLERTFPDAVFAGLKRGEDLARYYAASDVFVFPSRTDTFGLVVLEALASGLPVAAYPVTGPLDIIGDSDVGVLDEDLGRAARAALDIPSERCRSHALTFDWMACASQFLSVIESASGPTHSAEFRNKELETEFR